MYVCGGGGGTIENRKCRTKFNVNILSLIRNLKLLDTMTAIVYLSIIIPEEVPSGAAVEGTVLDLSLFGQVLGRLNRRLHAFHGKEGGEVGSVGRDHDESEEPPDSSHDTGGHSSVE